MAAILEIYGEMGHGALQALRDSSSFSIGISVGNTAITIDELLIVKARTKTDEYLSSQKPSTLGVLAKLPQNKHGYMAMHGDFKGLMEWGMRSATKVIDGDAETKKDIENMLAEMKDVDFGEMGWGFHLDDGDGDAGLIRGYTVSNVKPAAKMREAAHKMGSAYKMDLPGMKQKVTVEKDAESYDGVSADLITIKQTFDEEANPAAAFQNMFQELFHGKGGMVQRLNSGYDEGSTGRLRRNARYEAVRQSEEPSWIVERSESGWTGRSAECVDRPCPSGSGDREVPDSCADQS